MVDILTKWDTGVEIWLTSNQFNVVTLHQLAEYSASCSTRFVNG